ncbi:hypothetical protein Srot_2400 [Segniliparus rotundus DSM 44985]|uniref:Uncharacterized protein n=1 Tax=Segniliparus rotundus (strain ATCC BAA-972 / CDC 1076 / CIP 108378 / DSM 44985 / JCM 13578) TaxID=640132 RepID=D6ZAV8_SEGRD|nr:hypothetical protein [Segniliparus rotundus]ADG98844.1 hypothetical protein Srot_2400 [Segniliparus rotundus DSM 44985]
MTDGVWQGLANEYMVRKRPDDWYEGRDESEVKLAEAGDRLAAEFDQHENFIAGGGVSFQAPAFTGAVDIGGAPKRGTSHDPGFGLLRLTVGGCEFVIAAYEGAMWLARRCVAHATAFLEPGVPAPEAGESPYLPAGARVSDQVEGAVEDFKLLLERASARRGKGDLDDLAAHRDRKKTYRFTLHTTPAVGDVMVEVDGRGLVREVFLQREPELGRKLGWALRKAGIEAQAWCVEVVAPLLARVPSVGDIVPGFGEELGLDLTYGVADWPVVNDPEYMRERDEEFLPEVRLFRFAPGDAEKNQVERALAAQAERRAAGEL